MTSTPTATLEARGCDGPSRREVPDLRRLCSPVLVGRERELRLLREAAMRPPAVVFVEGEAGVGKSRLVREALCGGELSGRRVLVGGCHPLREPFPLGSVLEALGDLHADPPAGPLSPLAGALRPVLPELVPHLPPRPEPLGDPRAERHRLFRALRELLESVGPAVCVLEDLHWADQGTMDFLSFLWSQPPEGLALVLTYRPEELDPSSALMGLAGRLSRETSKALIELSALTVEQVRSLVAALLGRKDVGEELANRIRQQTAGIPFAVEEVVRLLEDRGDLMVLGMGRATGEAGELDVPPAIRHWIQERLGTLNADARLILRAAAVLGIPAREELMARVAGVSPMRGMRGLTQALRCVMLVETGDGRYGFRHALGAQSVYDDIPAPERRRLHLRAARALEAESTTRPLAQLAHHFKEANRPRQWVRYAEAAAEAATAIGDERTAARLLEEALSTAGTSRAARIRMAIRLGGAALYTPSPGTAIDLLEQTLDDEPMAVGVRGELRLSLARLRYHAGDTGAWREEMVRAVGELRRRPELAARAMVELAWPMLREGGLEEDLGWLRRGVRAAERTDNPVARTAVRAQRAAILLSVGDPAGWRAVGDIPAEGRSVEEKLQLLRGYHSLSLVTLGLGHYRHAESFLGEVARLENELEHLSWGPWVDSARVSLDWRTGRWDGLESRARELMDRTAGRPALSVGNQLVLGALLLSQGQVEEAERSFASALASARSRRWVSARVTASAWLARIRLVHGDAQGARRVAMVGIDVVKRKGLWVWGREMAPVAVQALLAGGRWADARTLVQEFTAGLRARDAPAAHASIAFCQAAVSEADGDYGGAAGLFERADRTWAELPSPYEAAQAREGRARCLFAEHDASAADPLLSALELFEGLGASWDAARVRAELRARRVAMPTAWRGGRRGYGTRLSPREAEVARLAGMGRKNREIAETLFLSPRTVEAHVASVLRKLGVESRRSLAAVAGHGVESDDA